MTFREKYWLTILLTFCRYASIMMMILPMGFAMAGKYINQLWYFGLLLWPLTIMWGIVNLKYIEVLFKTKNLRWNDILKGLKE